MDLFEFDFFRDWELDQQCHYEQERSVLKKKEWERRTQEVPPDEDLFSFGFNLFGEPYKTNKGDALANRVQSTLGNYDEMKELLTSQSNQSHLVGIPKSLVPQTPMEKEGQPRFFPEAQKGAVAPSHQCTGPPATTILAPPSTSLSGSTLLHSHQSAKMPRSSDWMRAGQSSGSTQPGLGGGGPPCRRNKHGVSTTEASYNRYEDQPGNQRHSSPSASPPRSRRHTQASKSPSREKSRLTPPKDQDLCPHGSSSPMASTSLVPGMGNFPHGIHCKPSAGQQKPTAYVRPMDGPDQVTSDSPELKPHMEQGDRFDSSAAGVPMDGKGGASKGKRKLARLMLPQSGEVSLSNESSCIEDILREMTHSWPPPLTAIHTPGKPEQSKFPVLPKDSQHIISGYNGQKWCNFPGSKSANKPVSQKSMLEDDLKLSSDEDDTDQVGDKTKPVRGPLSLLGPTTRPDESGCGSGASGSSSESESSSETDSDSESSSSDSEGNRPSRGATPEPEPPSTNKWQLDKWLNKVNPQSRALINTQPESHGTAGSQANSSQGLQEDGSCKGQQVVALAQPDSAERPLLSPIREKAKFRTGQRTPESKGAKLKSPGLADVTASSKTTGKRQPKKMAPVPNVEEADWLKGYRASPSPKEKELSVMEQLKPQGKSGGGRMEPRKEPRSVTAPTPTQDKKKHRGPSKVTPKSREFIETESSSSECHSDLEEQAKTPPGFQGVKSTVTVQATDGNNSATNSLAIANNSSVREPGVNVLEGTLFSEVPEIRNELPSPLRVSEEIASLWVKIELSFLTRIPGKDPLDPPLFRKAECQEPAARHSKQPPAAAVLCEKSVSKTKRKHKARLLPFLTGKFNTKMTFFPQLEHSDIISVNKKCRLEKEALLLPPCITPVYTHKLTSTKDSVKKQPRKKEEKNLPSILSSPSNDSTQYRTSAGGSIIQEGRTMSVSALVTSCPSPLSCSSSLMSSSTSKYRKGESKAITNSRTNNERDDCSKASDIFHDNGVHNPDHWPNSQPASVEILECKRPKLTFDDIHHNADYYMLEAKKLKHKADALLEKFGKALNYTDGALSFIECGNAMERDPLEAKSPYTMYSETVELIRYAMRLKNFTSHTATLAEKKLAVLCYRCLSLLYLRMFRLKKDHVMKYSRTLMEYFKNSAKSSQAPSPRGNNGKSTGTPSPASPSPSPLSSVCSGSSGPPAPPSSCSTVTIPQRIHHMAASHVNITSNILRSYEHWDTADRLSRESQEFFQELNLTMEPLTQQSTMTELVRYVRQGLHWLRIEAQLS
ncbi:AF4/FMR2 family member 2-like [Arapaima gigas]